LKQTSIAGVGEALEEKRRALATPRRRRAVAKTK